MEKLKTRNEYVGCNRKCRFYADEIRATSYDWWDFIKVINGKVIFNAYTYSSTTSRHQREVRHLMRSLGISIDHIVYMSKSLNDYSFEEDALRYYYNLAVKHIVKLHTKRTTKKTKESLRDSLIHLRKVIQELKGVGAEYSFSRLYKLYRYHKNKRDEHLGSIDFFKENKNKTFLIEHWNKKERATLVKRKNDEFTFNKVGGGQFTMYYNRVKDLKPCKLASIL